MSLKSLLNSTKSESALELFSSVHAHLNIIPFYLTGFDTAIAASQRESQLNRTFYGLQPGSVVDLHGAACSGKTSILYFLVMTTIVPGSWEIGTEESGKVSIDLGGRGGSIIFIDCDNRIDVGRIASMVHRHLETRVTDTLSSLPPNGPRPCPPTPDVYTAQTRAYLSRLHVFRPTSSFQLIATIQLLPEYFIRHVSEYFPFILLDSISAFVWQDNAEGYGSTAGINTQARQIIAALSPLRRNWGVTIVSTSWNLATDSVYRHPPPNLPPAWNTILTHRFLLARKPNPVYPPNVKVEEVINDKAREAVVKEGRCKGRLVYFAVQSGTRDETMNKAVGGDESAVFEFLVNAEGVMDA